MPGLPSLPGSPGVGIVQRLLALNAAIQHDWMIMRPSNDP